MRFITLSKDKYEYIILQMKQLKKVQTWENFTMQDTFYIVDGKKERIASIIEDDGSGAYGVSIFLDNDGLNSVHDLFSIKTDSAFTYSDLASIHVLNCKKTQMEKDEIKYFESKDIKLKAKDNLVLRTHKKGYMPRIPTNKEADEIIKVLDVLIFLVNREKDTLLEGFKESKAAHVGISYKKQIYSLNMLPLPYLEREYEYVPFTLEEKNEFEKCEITDNENFFLTRNAFVPVKTKDSNIAVTPLFCVYADEEYLLLDSEVIVAVPENYRSYMISMLKELFEEYGIPKKLTLNNRQLYFSLYELLNSLGIELSLKLENESIDNFMFEINDATGEMLNMGASKEKKKYIDENACRAMFDFVNKLITSKMQLPGLDENDPLSLEVLKGLFDFDDEDDDVEYTEVKEELIS